MEIHNYCEAGMHGMLSQTKSLPRQPLQPIPLDGATHFPRHSHPQTRRQGGIIALKNEDMRRPPPEHPASVVSRQEVTALEDAIFLAK